MVYLNAFELENGVTMSPKHHSLIPITNFHLFMFYETFAHNILLHLLLIFSFSYFNVSIYVAVDLLNIAYIIEKKGSRK